jgi:K+/H+ antiporter YhaU regulatory subunit KhtT
LLFTSFRPFFCPFPLNSKSKAFNMPLAKSGLLAGHGTTRVIAIRTATGTVVQPDEGMIIGTDDVVIVQGRWRVMHGIGIVRRNHQLQIGHGHALRGQAGVQRSSQLFHLPTAHATAACFCQHSPAPGRRRHPQPPAGSAQDNSKFAAEHGLQVLAFEGAGGDGSDDVEFASRRGAGAAAGSSAAASTLAQVWGCAKRVQIPPSASGAVAARRCWRGGAVLNARRAIHMHPPISSAQVIVCNSADVIGQTIRDTGFRSRFDAAVIAVKRNNMKQGGRLGDVALKKVSRPLRPASSTCESHVAAGPRS